MKGHTWKVRDVRVSSRFPRKDELLLNSPNRAWDCSVCGCQIIAYGDEKMTEARHRMKIPADCNRVIIQMVHRV